MRLRSFNSYLHIYKNESNGTINFVCLFVVVVVVVVDVVVSQDLMMFIDLHE